MEVPSVATQSSAVQAYAVQQQNRRPNGQSEEITRKEAENARASNQTGDRVTLSPESRDIAVQQVDQTQRQDETQRNNDARAQDNERQDQARLRAANTPSNNPTITPRSVTQALEAYSKTSLV